MWGEHRDSQHSLLKGSVRYTLRLAMVLALCFSKGTHFMMLNLARFTSAAIKSNVLTLNSPIGKSAMNPYDLRTKVWAKSENSEFYFYCILLAPFCVGQKFCPSKFSSPNCDPAFSCRIGIYTLSHISTDAPDCYGPPKMLILVFVKFRENQE